MIKKAVFFVLGELIKVKQFLFLLSDFNITDSFKLRYSSASNSGDDFLYIEPKKWGHNIKLRNNYRDKRTFRDVLLEKYHLPPKGVELKKDSIVLDLGSNTGLTIAHMKNKYPEIKIFGYEMDVDNFQLAKRNTKTYSGVYLFNKAIWVDNSQVEYFKDASYDGYSINSGPSNEGNTKIEGTTINDIVEEHQLQNIDYLKMDIEGAEKNIFNYHDLSWMNYVSSMNIEMHLGENETIESYIEIIKNKGFKVWKDRNHFSSIIAIKDL